VIINVIVILILIYSFFLFAVIQKYLFLTYVLDLANKLDFNYYVHFRDQPRIKGNYKNHEFQIHYRYKLGGHFPGKERTYVKLKLEKRYNLDENKFNKYLSLPPFNIIVIRYMKRLGKQYLLMKVAKYIVDKKSIKRLMDQLYKVYEETKKD
jgi:hypothetical protein